MNISEPMKSLIITWMLVHENRFLIYHGKVIDITDKLTESEKLSFTKEFEKRKVFYLKFRKKWKFK